MGLGSLRVAVPLVLALLAAPAVNAQSTGPAFEAVIIVTGAIAPQTLPSFCQEESHYLLCNGIFMKSSSLDLGAYEQGLWTFHAVMRGVECPMLDVVAVEKPIATLLQCGSPVPECPMRLRIDTQGLPQAYFLIGSASSAFTPLLPLPSFLGTLRSLVRAR
jgi:hypothetical protein